MGKKNQLPINTSKCRIVKSEDSEVCMHKNYYIKIEIQKNKITQ